MTLQASDRCPAIVAQDVTVPSLSPNLPGDMPDGADATLVAPLEECPICFNELERPTRTPCQHWFCRRAAPVYIPC